MGYSKFTSMTASLVARNAAAPAVSWAHDPDGREMPERRCALSDSLLEEGYGRWRSTERNDLAPTNSHRPRARKLLVALTDAEYEAVDLIAAKTGLTRHHVVRNALNGYFKWLVDEYASTCSCIAVLCANGRERRGRIQ